MPYSIEVPLDGYAALYIRKKPSAKKNTASKKDSDKVRREKK